MRREYFLLCYKRYREGSFQLRPVSYTHYVYCRMTVMQSRIDNYFFLDSDVFGFGIFKLFSYRQMQENRWKATLKNTPRTLYTWVFWSRFFFRSPTLANVFAPSWIPLVIDTFSNLQSLKHFSIKMLLFFTHVEALSYRNKPMR